MGEFLDSITVFADNVTGGGGWDSLPAVAGQSLSLRYLGEGSTAELLECWGGNNNSKCDFSIRSPLLHDNTRGMRFSYEFNPTLNVADGNPQLFMGPYYTQHYQPTDTLVVETLATATADVTFTQLIRYTTSQAIGGRFLSYDVVKARAVNRVGIRVSPSAHATTSTFGTAEAINSDDDRLKANTEYALVGINTDLPFTTLIFYGPDTGNLPIAVPGHWNNRVSADWFYELSRRFNTPLCPVINSNNKSVTYTAVADAGGGSAPLITLQFVELSKL
jgi:hypothetical protein